jgi:hypothetical protein
MPRVTCLRVLYLIVLIWLCLIFAWFLLPSPQIPRSLRSNHIQATLRSGEIITTIHEWDRQVDECAAYAIDWQLEADHAHDSVTLRLGKAHINLTHLAVQHSPPFLSDQLQARVRSGDLDHIINMPWFDYADANLFHHQMHGFHGQLNVRALVSDSKEVQIWKDAASFNQFTGLAQLDDERRATGLLATFSKVQTIKGARASISGIVVSGVRGRLPSKTYYLRSAMLEILAPTLTVVLFLLETIVYPPALFLLMYTTPVVTVYAFVVLVCWFAQGQQPFNDWSRTFPLTRSLRGKPSRKKRRKRTWGPSGPVLEDSADESSDEFLSASSTKPFGSMLLPRFRSPSAILGQEKAS